MKLMKVDRRADQMHRSFDSAALRSGRQVAKMSLLVQALVVSLGARSFAPETRRSG
ncbi:MAG: hypothetical protein JWO13_64 [Acidobacteriales bacterium]|nr:hypothetical protein [Terriglobales bacterium]